MEKTFSEKFARMNEETKRYIARIANFFGINLKNYICQLPNDYMCSWDMFEPKECDGYSLYLPGFIFSGYCFEKNGQYLLADFYLDIDYSVGDEKNDNYGLESVKIYSQEEFYEYINGKIISYNSFLNERFKEPKTDDWPIDFYQKHLEDLSEYEKKELQNPVNLLIKKPVADILKKITELLPIIEDATQKAKIVKKELDEQKLKKELEKLNNKDWRFYKEMYESFRKQAVPGLKRPNDNWSEELKNAYMEKHYNLFKETLEGWYNWQTKYPSKV